MGVNFFDRFRVSLKAFWHDEEGIILPYVTVMMIAIMGLATLALDAARYTSFQTQMQAAADALALAGARELDGSTGSQTRATNAINSMLTSKNELVGFGPDAPTPAAATIAFYSALPAASAGFGGTPAVNDGDSKYVGVTLSPATVPTILPVREVSNQLTTSAQAIAGYDFAVCNMPPVFICNPYEQQGDTNATADNRWRTQVALSTNQQQLMRLTVNGGSGYGPGHFGFLMPPDNCTGANCLIDWIAKRKPPACYRKKAVDLNTGQMQSVFDAFNVRFDLYSGSIKATADYGPAANVRKGYLSGSGMNGGCSPIKQDGAAPNPKYGVLIPKSSQISGTFTTTGNSKSIITGVAVPSNIIDGVPIEDVAGNTYIPTGTLIASHTATSITMSANAIKAGTVGFTFGGPGQATAIPLPLDLNMIGNTNSPGNGQWDCQDYWKIVHGTTPPTGCGDGASTPTNLSRFDIYQMESALLNDAAGPAAPAGGGEIGGPTCNAANASATDGGGGDRRTIYAAIINCMANASLMNQGGQTADDIPVAGFGKFFMTQPADTGNQTLIGEMTGAVGLDKNAKNNVQLYR